MSASDLVARLGKPKAIAEMLFRNVSEDGWSSEMAEEFIAEFHLIADPVIAALSAHEATIAELERREGEAIELAIARENDAILATRRAEAAEARNAELLEKFVPAYEPWMDDHSDDTPLTLHRSGNTFGDLRRARALSPLKKEGDNG